MAVMLEMCTGHLLYLQGDDRNKPARFPFLSNLKAEVFKYYPGSTTELKTAIRNEIFAIQLYQLETLKYNLTIRLEAEPLFERNDYLNLNCMIS